MVYVTNKIILAFTLDIKLEKEVNLKHFIDFEILIRTGTQNGAREAR